MKQESSRESPIAVLLPLSLILGLVLLLSLNPGQIDRSAVVISPLEEWLKVIIGYLAAGAEIAAAIAIGGAIVRGILIYIRQFCSHRQHFDAIQLISWFISEAIIAITIGGSHWAILVGVIGICCHISRNPSINNAELIHTIVLMGS
jgi:hypothetical protein